MVVELEFTISCSLKRNGINRLTLSKQRVVITNLCETKTKRTVAEMHKRRLRDWQED